MERIDMNDLPCFAMSPGLDGWRQEQRPMSITSEVKPMNPCSGASFDSNPIYGARDGQSQEVVVKKDNLIRSNSVDRGDHSMPVSSEKSLRSFKFSLLENFKEKLKPYFVNGKINRLVHKMIIKKSMSKIINSCGTSGIPENDRAIKAYLTSSEAKISKLILAYVKKYQKEDIKGDTCSILRGFLSDAASER